MMHDIDFYLTPYEVTKCGKIIRKSSELKLSQTPDRDGYLQIRLSYRNKQKTFKVHRLVGYVHLSKNCLHLQINHKDGNKKNNNIDNLEWVTNAENNAHKHSNGLSDRSTIKKTNKTGYVGVSFDKDSGKYIAQIQRNKKKKTIGRYKTPDEANAAYIKYLKSIGEIYTDEPVELEGIKTTEEGD